MGLAHFEEWWRTAFGRHSPWGDEESPAIVTAAETALEREMSNRIMQGGGRPEIFTLEAGAALTRQGEPGTHMFLLLDGVLRVEVDGRPLAELGPGAVVGERAGLEGGGRTAALVAVTPCRVAVADPAVMDRENVIALQAGHRREVTG